MLSSFAAGLLFGLGLIVSQMVNPAKVLAFLDVAGAWAPSLAFVMIGAIAGVITTETHIAFRTYSRHDLEAAFSLGLD